MPERELYSLRQVVELTGLSEFTLRGWETRYGAFRPTRTETGRRGYTSKDLQKAILLRELTKRGERIGPIARLPMAQLSAMMESADLEIGNAGESPEVDEALRLTALQKWEELESLFRLQGKKRSVRAVALDFVMPLLAGLSRLVGLGHLSIAQEHLLSSLVKDLLHGLRARAPAPHRTDRRFVIAAPEGDYHELGILLAHALVCQAGYRSLYLGPNSPKAEICETALQFGATHVVLGATVARAEGAQEALPSFLHFLDAHLPSKVTLWIGGREGARFHAHLARRHAVFSSIRELDTELG